MLNRVILMGRITQDLEVRQTPSGNAVLRFNVAVDRPVRQGAERQTDFITCTAWGHVSVAASSATVQSASRRSISDRR